MLQLGAKAEVVCGVGPHSYHDFDGVVVVLVPPGLVGRGEEHLDSVSAALREGAIKALRVPAFRLRLLSGHV